jgi:anaerobic dimethyl sulfoxide reductase subunit A
MPPINTGTVYPPPFPSPVLCNGNADALAHVLREKLDKGEISVEDFNAEIGNPHPEIGVPNPKMLVNFASVFYYSGYNPMQNTYDTNERLSVLKNTEFVAIAARMRNEVMVQFADIVLPITYQFFHEFCFHASGAGFGGPLDNYIILNPKVTAPVGEAKSELWIETRLAAKLGVGDQVNPRLQNVTDDQWDQAVEALYKEGYEYWTNRDDVKKLVPNPPTWEQLKRQGIIRVPKTSYWVPAQDFIVDKSRKIPTASGKIEFYSDAVAKGPSANGLIMLGDWEPFNFGKGFLPPMFQYVPTKYSIQGSKAVEYPLMMITPHSYYRHHSGHDLNPMTNDEYRHACWLNPADANSRGIKDNDLVHVFSDAGEIMVPAYVTSRIVPGVVIVRFGAWYQPSGMKTPLSPFGVDIRGNPNILIPDDRDGQPIGIDFAATMVEVEKFKEVA